MKKKYPKVGTVPKTNIKIVESGKIDTTNTPVYDFNCSGLVQALQ